MFLLCFCWMNHLGFSVKAMRKASTHLTENHRLGNKRYSPYDGIFYSAFAFFFQPYRLLVLSTRRNGIFSSKRENLSKMFLKIWRNPFPVEKRAVCLFIVCFSVCLIFGFIPFAVCFPFVQIVWTSSVRVVIPLFCGRVTCIYPFIRIFKTYQSESSDKWRIFAGIFDIC